MKKDNVEITANSRYYIAWRCVACGRVQHEICYDEDTRMYHDMDPEKCEDETREDFVLRAVERQQRINAGQIGMLLAEGCCTDCRKDQPWSALAYLDDEKAAAKSERRQRKQKHARALGIAFLILFFASPLIMLIDRRLEVMSRVPGYVLPMAAGGLGILALIALISSRSGNRQEARSVVSHIVAGVEQMKADGQADCLPLAAYTYEAQKDLPQDDPRTRLLCEKVPKDMVLRPSMSHRAWDDINPQ